MKKLMWAATAIMVAMIAMSSCDNDKDSEATIPYMGKCAAIAYADSGDVVYQEYIEGALGSEGIALTGENSLFQKSAKIKDTSAYIVELMCDQNAAAEYLDKVNKLTDKKLRFAMDELYGDSVNFDTLDAFNLTLELYGFAPSYGRWMKIGDFKWEP